MFKIYSAYYDLLYNDKDYKHEADYINNLIQENLPGAKTILNLGCGTGRHDFEFAKLGYDVSGIDLSQDMIDIARRTNNTTNITFDQGDIRTVRLNKKYDVVVALFHVMSYQTGNKDIEAVFETVRLHLKEGGLFIFDYWYGPGVLTDPPVVREKQIENDLIKVVRKAEPVMHYDKNAVEVNYEIQVTEKSNGKENTFREQHMVRYLFLPELSAFAGAFTELNHYTWLTTRRPYTDWYSVSIYKMP
ncbi:MAG: SAM-dependent methyltransferase, type 11 [Bacteroidota bacterium]|nr:SAM-dependent methyltransferase, type 11 [Bacteroidota bacterium]